MSLLASTRYKKCLEAKFLLIVDKTEEGTEADASFQVPIKESKSTVKIL